MLLTTFPSNSISKQKISLSLIDPILFKEYNYDIVYFLFLICCKIRRRVNNHNLETDELERLDIRNNEIKYSLIEIKERKNWKSVKIPNAGI